MLEEALACAPPPVLGWNKMLAGYQPDEVYLEGAPRHTKAPVNRRDKDIDITVDCRQVLVLYLWSFHVRGNCDGCHFFRTTISQDTHSVLASLCLVVF
jgi:hypothetical protein